MSIKPVSACANNSTLTTEVVSWLIANITKKHPSSTLQLLGSQGIRYKKANNMLLAGMQYLPSRQETLTQCWYNVGPAS